MKSRNPYVEFQIFSEPMLCPKKFESTYADMFATYNLPPLRCPEEQQTGSKVSINNLNNLSIQKKRLRGRGTWASAPPS
jgi:hypothetical protein